MSSPLVSIIMGSSSDLHIMKKAHEMLNSFDIENEITVISAHRTPERMMKFAKNAKKRGIKVIIAGAGGAAHLPGMVASMTPLPVIGVPILSSNSIAGIDSLLSIVQMPSGIPVATMAVDGGANAGILASRIIGTYDEEVSEQLEKFEKSLQEKVEKQLEDTIFTKNIDA